MSEQDPNAPGAQPQDTPPSEDPNATPAEATPEPEPEPIEGDQGPQVADQVDQNPANAQGTSFDPDRPVRTTPPAPHELAGSPEVAEQPTGFATPTELGTGNSDATSEDAIVADEPEAEVEADEEPSY